MSMKYAKILIVLFILNKKQKRFAYIRKKPYLCMQFQNQRINLTACDLYKIMLKPCASSENSRLEAFLSLNKTDELLIYK